MYILRNTISPHNFRHVVNFFNQRFDEQLIVGWPVRSLFDSLRFFSWKPLKNKISATPPTAQEDLENLVRDVIAGIAQEQLDNVMGQTLGRTILCRNQNGRHFEHLL